MVILDNLTLMLAVSAVSEKVKRYERMLAEGNHSPQLETLLDSYKQASKTLQESYLSTIRTHQDDAKELVASA